MPATLTDVEVNLRKSRSRPWAIDDRSGKECGPRETLETVWKIGGWRYLVVVFTIRDQRLRPVTARTMNQRERRIYAKEIDKTA
jgi:uncharacterized DUF497 family protein